MFLILKADRRRIKTSILSFDLFFSVLWSVVYATVILLVINVNMGSGSFRDPKNGRLVQLIKRDRVVNVKSWALMDFSKDFHSKPTLEGISCEIRRWFKRSHRHRHLLH